MNGHAVVFPAPNEVAYLPVVVPDPGPDDVVVRVTHSWISNGTEGSFLRGERIAGDTPRAATDPMPFPIVVGYQKVGIVESVGDGVEDISAGETVFAAMGKIEGMFYPVGGHVSPSVTPRKHIWKLPTDCDPVAFSGMVLTQVGYNCGTRPDPSPGDIAVVVGDGMVGHWAAQTLAWRGCQTIMIGRHVDRLARFSGGHNRSTVLSSRSPASREIEAATGGGIDILVDTAGDMNTVEMLLPLLGKHAHIVSAGFYGTADRLPLQPLRDAEISVDLVSGWSPERMNDTRELIAARYLDTLGLITHRFPAHEAPEAWKCIQEKRDGCLGVVLEWFEQ